MRMKDDERRLLGVAQEAGEFMMLPDISEDRCNVVLKQWASIGLVDLESGRLTAKGKAVRGAIVPQAEPIAVELEPEPIVLESALDDEDSE